MTTSMAPRTRLVRLLGMGSFLVAEGVDGDALLEAIRTHRGGAEPCRPIKVTRDRRITRVPMRVQGSGRPGSPGTIDVVVKEILSPWRWRAVHALGWPSRFCRDAETTSRLDGMGILVPRFEAASYRVGLGPEYLVTEHVGAATSLRDLLWYGPEVLSEAADILGIFDRLGGWLRRLHDRGVWHRDVKPENVLVRHGHRDFVLVDTTDVRFQTGPLGEPRRTRNLAQLLDLPARFDGLVREPFLLSYLGGEAGILGGWSARVEASLSLRRASRKARRGFYYVDEAFPDRFVRGTRLP